MKLSTHNYMMSSPMTSAKRARTSSDVAGVVFNTSDEIRCVVYSDLSKEDQEFSQQLVGEKYFLTYKTALRDADESDGLRNVDTWGAQLEACEIDPEDLQAEKKQRAISIFGDGKAFLEAPDLYFSMRFRDGKSHEVECREPTDVPHPNPKFAGMQQYVKTVFLPPKAEEEEEEESHKQADSRRKLGGLVCRVMDGVPMWVRTRDIQELVA
jgi:hypothetical protein